MSKVINFTLFISSYTVIIITLTLIKKHLMLLSRSYFNNIHNATIYITEEGNIFFQFYNKNIFLDILQKLHQNNSN